MEFTRNRSYEEGKIIPNKTLSSMMVAIEKAQNFIKANSRSPSDACQIQQDYGRRKSIRERYCQIELLHKFLHYEHST